MRNSQIISELFGYLLIVQFSLLLAANTEFSKGLERITIDWLWPTARDCNQSAMIWNISTEINTASHSANKIIYLVYGVYLADNWNQPDCIDFKQWLNHFNAVDLNEKNKNKIHNWKLK